MNALNITDYTQTLGLQSKQASALMAKAPVAIKKEADFGHPRANRQVRLGQLLVDYEFNRGQRRSIGFCVGPAGLAVRAPKWVTLRVDDALQAKASWILRKLQASRERLTRQASQVIDWRDGVVLPCFT